MRMRNVLGNNQKQQPVLQRSAKAQKPSSIFRLPGCLAVLWEMSRVNLRSVIWWTAPMKYEPRGPDESARYQAQHKNNSPLRYTK